MGAPEDFEGLEAATGLTSRILTQSLGYIYGDSRLFINGGFCPYHRRGQRGDQSRRRLTMGTLQGRNVS